VSKDATKIDGERLVQSPTLSRNCDIFERLECSIGSVRTPIDSGKTRSSARVKMRKYFYEAMRVKLMVASIFRSILVLFAQWDMDPPSERLRNGKG
jgi:hypothetical protein